MAIYVTGDIHGEHSIRKLSSKRFPKQRELGREDYLIICGDFGLIWNENRRGKRRDEYWLDWLDNKNFTTLFIDGNHENFNLLESYPIEMWNGGKVHRIKENVLHLMRGQVFTLEGQTFFTMGGGTSIDKEFRVEGKSWWPQEAISLQEFDEAIENLDKYNWKVDFVLTHTVSNIMMNEDFGFAKEHSLLTDMLDVIQRHLTYKQWYFGHFHVDVVFEDIKATGLYNAIIEIDNIK